MRRAQPAQPPVATARPEHDRPTESGRPVSRVKSDPVTATDAELIRDVRAGDNDAYGLLYERHAPAAQRFARRLAGNPHAADDALADAFTKILAAIRNGSGPTTSFRPYLFTAVRTTVIRGTRWRKRVDLTDPAGWDLPGDEPTSDPADRALILEAFATLPERSRAVLWHLEAEGLTPAEVAPILGLSANGVSALAYRSREALRQAYLQAHLAQPLPGSCRSVADLLPAKVRDDLTTRQRRIVDDHLHECDRCRSAVTELDDVATAFRTVAGPLIGAGGLWSLLRRTSHVSLPVSPRRVAAVAAIAATERRLGSAAAAPVADRTGGRAARRHRRDPHRPDGAAGAAGVGDGVPISIRVPLAHRQAASGPTGSGSAARAPRQRRRRPDRRPLGDTADERASSATTAAGREHPALRDRSERHADERGNARPRCGRRGRRRRAGRGRRRRGRGRRPPSRRRAGRCLGRRGPGRRGRCRRGRRRRRRPDRARGRRRERRPTWTCSTLSRPASIVDAGLDLGDGSVDLGTAIAADVPRLASLATDLGLGADLSGGTVAADTAVAADLLDAVETDANVAADVDLTEPSLDAAAQADLDLPTRSEPASTWMPRSTSTTAPSPPTPA